MIRPRPWPLLALLAVIPAAQLLVLVPELWRSAEEPRDYTAYIMAAERVRADEPLYQPVPPGPHVPAEGAPYLYPPFLAAILALVPVSGIALARFTLLTGLLCLWIYALSLDRIASGQNTAYGILLWGALLTAGIAPLGAVWVGQVDSLIWALSGIALAFPAVRGFGFAAAAMTKPFAVWPLGLAIWRERRLAIAGAAAAIFTAVGLSAAALGPLQLVGSSLEWLMEIFPSLSQGQFAYSVAHVTDNGTVNHVLGFLGTGNMSLAFLPLHLAYTAGWSPAGPDLPVWARAYLTAIGLAAPIAVLWLTRHRALTFRYAAVMCAAMLFGPIFRATYAPILYTLAAAWIGERRAKQHSFNRPAVPA